MGSWIHDGFLDSRWITGFTMDSWIHDIYLNFKLLAEWMLNPQEGGRLDAKRHYVIVAKALDGFGQLVMPVQCRAEARRWVPVGGTEWVGLDKNVWSEKLWISGFTIDFCIQPRLAHACSRLPKK